MPARKSISQALREAAKKSGLSLAQIKAATGIDRGEMSRFLAGKVGLGQKNLEALADLFGLSLVADKPAKSKAGRKGQ